MCASQNRETPYLRGRVDRYVNGYTCRGSNSSNFYASLLSWGQLLKERICSSRSKFFTSFQRLLYPEKQPGTHSSIYNINFGKVAGSIYKSRSVY